MEEIISLISTDNTEDKEYEIISEKNTLKIRSEKSKARLNSCGNRNSYLP